MKYKVAIITYIFGDYETLRDVKFINHEYEYICVTDSYTDIKSNTWKIIKDSSLDELNNNRDKMVMVKYNPFKYSDADILITIDGSIQIIGDLQDVINESAKHDIGLRIHHLRNNLYDELNAWKTSRGMPDAQIDKFKKIMLDSGYNIKYKGLFETCIILYKNSDFCKELCRKEIELMLEIGENGSMCMTNQCPFTFIMNRYYNKSDVYYFTWFDDKLLRYSHKKTNPLILKQKCQPFIFNNPI